MNDYDDLTAGQKRAISYAAYYLARILCVPFGAIFFILAMILLFIVFTTSMMNTIITGGGKERIQFLIYRSKDFYDCSVHTSISMMSVNRERLNERLAEIMNAKGSERE